MGKTSFDFVFFSCPYVAKEFDIYIERFKLIYVVGKASTGCNWTKPNQPIIQNWFLQDHYTLPR